MPGKRKSLPGFVTLLRYRILMPALWRLLGRHWYSGSQILKGAGFSIAEFSAHLSTNSRLRFFFHPRNQKDFFRQLISNTQSVEEILAEADDVLMNRFETLGSGKVDLGSPIPWRRDFVSGREWPAVPLSNDDILDLEHSSDIKIPWELSRFHQVWWLGKAYWLNGNETYARKFGELIEHWIIENPPGKGPNWAVAMEVAIRSCNWIVGYYFFCESKSLRSEFWTRFFQNLIDHGTFLETHLEYSRVNGNHFLSNITGLIYLGVFFQDLPRGKRWLRWAVPQLETAMQEQVYDDGVNHEHSTSYHRLVLELFYSAALLCQRNNIRLSDGFWNRLEKMVEYVQAYSRPDGSIPLIGDSDDGRLFRISMNQDVNDHRHALSVGAVLFKRADFKRAAGRFDQEALWYFGGEGFEAHQMLREEIIDPVSRSFPTAGFYILRNNEAHVFADAGEIGMRGRGGHGHNDTLSFELWFRGQPFVVDPGTYTYTRDPNVRNIFRGTRMHNTVSVDGRELAEFGGLWNIVEDATRPRVLKWSTTNEIDILEAEHHGYSRLSSPVVHRRSFELRKNPFQLTITDHLSGDGEHEVELPFHLHPEVQVEPRGQTQFLLLGGSSTLLMELDRPAIVEQSLYSPSYGVKVVSRALRIRARVALPFSMKARFTNADNLSKNGS